MTIHTNSVEKLIDKFAEMPGIGRKSAERLAYYVLKLPKDDAMELAFAIRDVKKNIRHCPVCFNLAEGDACLVCADKRRHNGLLCVVEYPRDLAAIEAVGEYQGLYHVLMGVISPVDETLPEDVKVQELLDRVADGAFSEIIIFTNATAEGEYTAHYIAAKLRDTDIRISRMARGIPAGSELEFVNKGVITDALNGRVRFDPGD